MCVNGFSSGNAWEQMHNNHFFAVSTVPSISLKFLWEEEVDLQSLKNFLETIWTTEHVDSK